MLNAFIKYLRSVQVLKAQSGQYVDGEWEKGSVQNQNVRMIAIPITPQQVRNLPEGAYQAGDMKFYVKGPVAYAPGDIFIVDGIRFVVRDILNRYFEGNFTIYIAKKDYDNA